jgi:hypothetical protein
MNDNGSARGSPSAKAAAKGQRMGSPALAQVAAGAELDASFERF